MPRDDRRVVNTKDQRYRDRDVRDRDRDRESRDRDRERGDRDRGTGSNMVSTSTSNNSKDRKGSSSSSRSMASTSSSSASTRKVDRDENHKAKPEKEAAPPDPDSSDEDAGYEPTITAQELFESVVEVENNEAKALDVDGHLNHFLTTCQKVEMLMDELYELKLRGDMKTPAFSRKQMECLLLLTSIRELNRLYKLRLKLAKDSVSDQRQKVDADHLRLQNLIYEATHLNDQVSAVQDYKGFDEDIELIPVDKFYKEAPPAIVRGDATKENPHMLKVARLEYEYTQRQTLTEKCAELEKEQERVSAEILERQAKLSSIAPILEKILDAAKPLEDFFQLDITGKRKMDELAKSLPTPLYTLYVSSIGYAESESMDGEYDFKVKIGGDVEAAKQMTKRVPPNAPKDEDLDDVSPMEIDDEDVAEQDKEEEDVSKRRKLKKHLSIMEEKIDTRAKIVEKHPLYVEWILELPEGEIFTITYHYIIRLNIVTITVKDNIKALPWKFASFLNKSEHILGDLYEDDDGEVCPNSSAEYTLRKADVENFNTLIPEIGRPYKWVQKVCGLLFLADDAEEGEQPPKSKSAGKRRTKISRASIPGALALLRSRVNNKLKLWKLLKSLESGKIVLPYAVEECLPTRDAVGFSSMEPIEYSAYQGYGCTKDARLDHIPKPTDLFLKFAMQRENRKLTALFNISQDYPEVTPGVVFRLKEGGKEVDELNGHSLRKIRREVNCDAPYVFKQFSDHILCIQLRILRDRMDNISLDFDEIAVRVNRMCQ